jgi:S1-C subfamily serine protease
VIVNVQPNTPADRYRLPIGGVIVDVDGVRITSPQDLEELLLAAAPGDQWEVSYYVRQQRYRTKLRLSPAAAADAAEAAVAEPLADDVLPPLDEQPAAGGLSPLDLPPGGLDLAERLNPQGRRPILGRLGRVLDQVLEDPPAGLVPPPGLVVENPLPEEPRGDDAAPVDDLPQRPRGEELTEAELLREQVELLREEVKLLRRRVDSLERQLQR